MYKSPLKNSLLLLLIIFANYSHAINLISLTTQEKLFLKNNPSITLGSDTGWGPYVIHNKNRAVSGYDADILSLINQVSGANFVLTLGGWSEIIKAQKERDIDGLSTATINENFRHHSLFSDPYISLQKIIFSRKDLPYSVNSLADLKGKKFGIYKANIVARATAKKIKDVKIIEFANTQDLIEGVTTGKADFMLGNAAMFYLLNKSGNPFLKPALFLHHDPLNLVFVMRNDFPEAISIINKSLQKIGNEKMLEIKNKWFSSTIANIEAQGIKFSQQELHYLTEKKQLNLCIDPDWMPLEKLYKGKHIGISADYFKLFQENIDIPIVLVKTKTWAETLSLAQKRACDIISLATPTEQRKKYLNFTTPLIKSAIVLATRPDITFIDNFSFIGNKKIGSVKDNDIERIIYERYKDIDIIHVESAQQGLQMVVDGKLFAYVDRLPTIAYLFQRKFFGELKISGTFDSRQKLSVATRNDEPILLNIMNKLIKQIPENAQQKILNRYVSINYRQGVDSNVFWPIIITLIGFSILFLFRYYTVTAYNRHIEQYSSIIDDHVLTYSFDDRGNITKISNALCQLSGYKKSQLTGQHYSIFHHPKTEISVYKSLWSTIIQGKHWQGELLNLNKNGSSFLSNTKITPIYNPRDVFSTYTAILQDISDKKRLEKLVITDPLTQIPNRLFINNSFKHEFERSKRYQRHFSLILIDVDFFKKVNDQYGHKKGDDVLINLATILTQNIRQLDQVARWGGEEFLIICPETNIQQAAIVAEKVRGIIEQFEFSEHFTLTCSFGVSQSDQNDDDESIFLRVDNALYEAKHKGRNQVILNHARVNELNM